MKNILLIVLVFCLSCKNEGVTSLSDNFVHQPEQLYINDTILQCLNDYILFTQNSKEIVYQIFIDQDPDSITFYLTYTQYQEQIFILHPSGYLKTRGRLFVLYSGLSPFLLKDTDFLKDLQEEVSKYKLKISDQRMSLIEYDSWKIVFYYGTDTYNIRKRGYGTYENIGIFR